MREEITLPDSIQEIAETIGLRLALRIVQEFGGMDVEFPARPHDEHPIIAALGKDDGYAICEYMNGQSFSVPVCKVPRNWRAEIKRLEAEGLSRGEIARRLGITQRWVRKVANAPPPTPKQMNLFDT